MFLCSVAAYLAKPSSQPFLMAWQSLKPVLKARQSNVASATDVHAVKY